ncbi:hypothetical protein GCM10008013_41440 [Paenibacillus segetis]|uniref:Uncharacterized protein n=2 Tax=Paenibacillus segetis TaxID=1325360 RepID=A0ABQ1YRN2_9BACL|nr:hypothetical protein GCM10008013_41440 [Paenibacillus segetis]
MNQVWEDQRLIRLSSKDQVIEALQKRRIRPNVKLEGTMNLAIAAREDEENGITYCMV